MSSARKVTRVEKVVQEVEVPDGIELKLSKKEAQFLMSVMRQVGGMEDTARGYASELIRTLERAEVPGKDFFRIDRHHTGSIYITSPLLDDPLDIWEA